jgi:predicted protein tyrosine phosphatase
MIKIMSAVDAAKEMESNPDFWNVISIRDVKYSGFHEHPMEHLMDRSIDGIVLNFDDVWDIKHEMLYGYVMPKIEHVKQAIEFAKGKDPLLIHCWAGCSRSTAMAYVIACTEMEPKEALNIFEDHHCPNPLIVELGAVILDNDEMLEVFIEYEERERINGKG